MSLDVLDSSFNVESRCLLYKLGHKSADLGKMFRILLPSCRIGY